MAHSRPVRLKRLERLPSLREKAYQSIRHSIFHDLSDGDPLVVDELAAQLGTSRTPVREALLALEAEGLVYTVPNQGTFVSAPSPHEVCNIYQVRSALESVAARLATPAIPDEELERLRAAFQAATKALEAGDVEPYLRSNAEFHRVVLRYAGNEVLAQVIGNLEDRVYRIRLLARRRSTRHLILAHREHCQTLEALIARDADRVEMLTRRHLTEACKRVLAILSGDGSSEESSDHAS